MPQWWASIDISTISLIISYLTYSFLRKHYYRRQLGHHDPTIVRKVLDDTFVHVSKLGNLHDLSKEDLLQVDFSDYRFMGELIIIIDVLFLTERFLDSFYYYRSTTVHCYPYPSSNHSNRLELVLVQFVWLCSQWRWFWTTIRNCWFTRLCCIQSFQCNVSNPSKY